MANERDAQKHGQRVLVMWLCWLALAMFLVAAGVVGFAQFVDVASAPDAGPRRAVESVAAAVPESLPRIARRREGDAPRTEAEPRRASAAEDVRTARVRFCLHRFGMSDTHYVGPLQLHVDGVPLPPVQVENRDPVEFALDRAARVLRCDAPGCAPAEYLLPPPPQDWPDPIEVKFWADAGLVFEVVGLPSDWQGTPTFAAASADHEVQLRDVRNWRPGTPTGCGFRSGSDFTWRAILRGATSLWLCSGRGRALQPGERRTVVVECGGLAPVRYQVVGPSPQLLPHLVVLALPPSGILDAARGVKLPLTESGGFERYGEERCRFAIGVRGGFAELREEPSAGGIRLHPESPLVGLQWRDGSGQCVLFSLLSGPWAPLHVCERANLPEHLLVQAAAFGSRRIATADLPTDSDLVDLDRLPCVALGAVVVTVRGEQPPSQCRLQVLRPDGWAVANTPATSTTSLGPLDPGTYDVRWLVDGAPGPWVAQRVAVAAGTTTLLADWPAMAVWTGEIAGHLEAPAGQRFLNVRFGDYAQITDGTWTNVDAGGRFRIGLPDAAEPDAVVTLRYAFMHVRAEGVSVDRERRHVVVRPPGNLRWIDVHIEPGNRATWCARLALPGRLMPWMMLWSREQRSILVPPGVVLGGALFAGADMSGDVLAWFDVDGTQSPVVVRRAAGRTVEFRNAGAAGRTLMLVGPRGQYDNGHQLSAKPLHLFVPDGTRGIWIHDPAQPDPSRSERAIDPGDVMLVR